MQDKNLIGNGLLRADGLERGSLSTENLEAIHRLVEAHQRRVARLRWTNIVAWFVLLMVFVSLLVAQNSHWEVDYQWLALDNVGLIILTGLTYVALVSWYLLYKAIKNPPSEGGMRMTDIQVRLDRIEALLEDALQRAGAARPVRECDPAKQDQGDARRE